MTNKQIASGLRTLNNKLDKARTLYEVALMDLENALQSLHPDDTIVINDFPDDGLGVCFADGDDSHMSIGDAIKLIETRGFITREDPTHF